MCNKKNLYIFLLCAIISVGLYSCSDTIEERLSPAPLPIICPEESAQGNVSYYTDSPRNKYELRDLITARVMPDNAPPDYYADLNNIDVRNVDDMSYLFKRLPYFNGDISKWNTSMVRNMEGMFYGSLEFNGDISKWDTSSVTNMRRMFKLTTDFNQDISCWDTSNVTDMREMFYDARDFSQDLSRWNLTNVRDLTMMFRGSSRLENAPEWNATLGSVLDASSMFDASPLENSPPEWYDELPKFCDGYGLTTTMFRVTTLAGDSDVDKINRSLGELNIKPECLDTTNVRTIAGTEPNPFFRNGSEILPDKSTFNANISNWDVSRVVNMSSAFSDASVFDQDLSSWDVSSVEDMSYMFYYARKFGAHSADTLGIGSWDVSNVTTMRGMFGVTDVFNDDISSWDISQVEDISAMFYSAGNFSQDLEGWDTTKLKVWVLYYTVSLSFPAFGPNTTKMLEKNADGDYIRLPSWCNASTFCIIP